MASFSFFKVNVNVQYAHLEHSFYYQVASSYVNSKVTNILPFIFIMLLETFKHGYTISVIKLKDVVLPSLFLASHNH
jgi:hypothetical protein